MCYLALADPDLGQPDRNGLLLLIDVFVQVMCHGQWHDHLDHHLHLRQTLPGSLLVGQVPVQRSLHLHLLSLTTPLLPLETNSPVLLGGRRETK